MYTQVHDHMTGKPSDNVVQRDEDGAFIPFDEGNADYQEYVRWMTEGGKTKPPPAVPAPPIEEIPPPDITEVHAQVQDIDQRLSDLEQQVANVAEATAAFQRSLKS